MGSCLDIGASIELPPKIKRRKRARSIREALENDLAKIGKDFKMTRTPDMKESDGAFGPIKKELHNCVKCGEKTAECKPWQSSCGGYEDEKYTCSNCGHSWWVEGIDS
jgi:DNA-directed RNA polymerase subunit M/transcription elongation factor TFIIS